MSWQENGEGVGHVNGYLEQPAFGRLVSRLRRRQGLSQIEIAGEGVSSSYVSRLEAGLRAPTPQAVKHFAERLGVPEETFAARSPQVVAARLAEGVAALEEMDYETAVAVLGGTAQDAEDAPPEMAWQVLWNLARAHEQLGEHAARRRVLARVLAVAEQLDSATLQVKALAESAVCARLVGDVAAAVAEAGRALALCEQDPQVPRADRARALVALAAAETESGRLADAAHHAELAQQIPPEELGPLRVRVLWTAAAVAVRQGAGERGLALLEEALALKSRVPVLTWGRLRLAAVALSLRVRPVAGVEVLRWFREAETVLELVGTAGHQAELQAVAARLAFHQGDRQRAAELAAKALDQAAALSLHDRTRTEILLHQVRAGLGGGAGGDGGSGESLAALRALAEELRAAGSLDLAAEAWKALAEALVLTRK